MRSPPPTGRAKSLRLIQLSRHRRGLNRRHQNNAVKLSSNLFFSVAKLSVHVLLASAGNWDRKRGGKRPVSEGSFFFFLLLPSRCCRLCGGGAAVEQVCHPTKPLKRRYLFHSLLSSAQLRLPRFHHNLYRIEQFREEKAEPSCSSCATTAHKKANWSVDRKQERCEEKRKKKKGNGCSIQERKKRTSDRVAIKASHF